jgi:hypothetical protein
MIRTLGRLPAVAWVIFSAAQISVAQVEIAREDLVAELLKLDAPPPPSGLPMAAVASAESAQARDIFLPPGDDAPLDVLARYWAHLPPTSEANNISDKTRERLLEACDSYPELLPSLLDKLPKTPAAYDKVKALFDEHSQKFGGTWKDKVTQHLMLHSKYFRDSLISERIRRRKRRTRSTCPTQLGRS